MKMPPIINMFHIVTVRVCFELKRGQYATDKTITFQIGTTGADVDTNLETPYNYK